MSETESEREKADDYWQTHIYAPEKEYQTHASVQMEPPEREGTETRRGDLRELILTEGGDVLPETELSPDTPFLSQVDSSKNLSRTVVYDSGVAVGYYAHHLETHGVPEEEVWNQLERFSQDSDLPLDQYFDFHGTLNERQRRIRLMDLLEYRVKEGGDWAAKPYLSGEHSGSWRSTNLSESGKKLAGSISKEIELNPKHCYRNAQQAAIKHKDNHRVKYFEGVALPKSGAQVSRHAWVEIDGEVAELTWPWHFFDGKEAVYFGTGFSKGEVEEEFEARNGGSQIALSREEIAELNAINRGDI